MPSRTMIQQAETAARQLAELLKKQDIRIVLAESCTAGLVCSQLAGISGISQWLCGSFATYRDDSKRNWLGVESGLIAEKTAVSADVTREMAKNALMKTPEANLSVAITGHLEHGASSEGPCCFVCIAKRINDKPQVMDPVQKRLSAENRRGRQWQAAITALTFVIDSFGNL